MGFEEDFTTYTEIDPYSKLTKTATRVTWTNFFLSQHGYEYKNVETKPNFTYQVDFELTQIGKNNDSSSNSLIAIWIVTQLCCGTDLFDVGRYIGLFIREKGNSTVKFRLLLLSRGSVSDTSIDLDVGTTYYLRINKIDGVTTCTIYSDSERTTVVDTIIIDLTGEPEENMTFSFIEVARGIDAELDWDDRSSGYVEILKHYGIGAIGDWVNTGCGRILDIDIDEAVDFASKEILGKDTPTVNPDNYTTTPKRWTITMRMTLTKRIALKAEKDKHETLMFVLQGGESDYVKFEEMHHEWAGDECSACPWLVTIILISVLY